MASHLRGSAAHAVGFVDDDQIPASGNQIIEAFAQTPYRLACTATPAPNDYMELGNHAEFVGSMSRTEMLSMFFCHDGGDTSK